MSYAVQRSRFPRTSSPPLDSVDFAFLFSGPTCRHQLLPAVCGQPPSYLEENRSHPLRIPYLLVHKPHRLKPPPVPLSCRRGQAALLPPKEDLSWCCPAILSLLLSSSIRRWPLLLIFHTGSSPFTENSPRVSTDPWHLTH